MDIADMINNLLLAAENHQKTINSLSMEIDKEKLEILKIRRDINNIYDYLHREKINKEKIYCNMHIKIKNNFCGINKEPRSIKIIVSLTSYPERIYETEYSLISLLNQSFKPDMLFLWLAEEEFPNRENDLPDGIIELTKVGLTIKWCKNIMSYKKLIPVLEKYPDCIVITADDDLYYGRRLAEKLYNEYISAPYGIYCNRIHKVNISDNKIMPYKEWSKNTCAEKSSFLNFGTTGGGVLFPPLNSGIYHKDILNEELFMKLCPTTDDIWFWAMAVLGGHKINAVSEPEKIQYVNIDRDSGILDEKTLYSINSAGGNDASLKNIVEYYPEIMNILIQ